jgi:hypothetical protein
MVQIIFNYKDHVNPLFNVFVFAFWFFGVSGAYAVQKDGSDALNLPSTYGTQASGILYSFCTAPAHTRVITGYDDGVYRIFHADGT